MLSAKTGGRWRKRSGKPGRMRSNICLIERDGMVTPLTILRKRRVWVRENGARPDPKDDLDLHVLNLHPLDQCSQDGLAGVPFQVVEPVSNGGSKVSHR